MDEKDEGEGRECNCTLNHYPSPSHPGPHDTPPPPPQRLQTHPSPPVRPCGIQTPNFSSLIC